MLQKLIIPNYTTQTGFHFNELPLTYQLLGRELGTAPIVLVTHALTGNSNVGGENGWWVSLIGTEKCIDLKRFTVLSFNIPGNGYDGFLIENYEDILLLDVANWFLKGLEELNVKSVYTGVGGSLGGSILWQMALLKPDLFQNLIPVATDWKATDWLLAQCRVQKLILENSNTPLHDARVHAMTFYRTPQSFKEKFNRSLSETKALFNVETWLLHHGKRLEERFHLSAYKLLNHLLMTTKCEIETDGFFTLATHIKGNILLVGIDSDGFYLNNEIKETYSRLKTEKSNVSYSEINSIHGHDAFLIEYEQLSRILAPIFKPEELNAKSINYEHTNIG